MSTAEVISSAPQPKLEAPQRGGIESLLLDFLAYLELERGLSRNTLEAYRSDLLQFGSFLGRRGVRVTEASHGDLAAFIAELSGGGGARGTGGARGGSAGANAREPAIDE